MATIEGGGGSKPNWYQRNQHKTTGLADLKDEFAAFKEIDANKDGKLTEDELKAALAAERKERRTEYLMGEDVAEAPAEPAPAQG